VCIPSVSSPVPGFKLESCRLFARRSGRPAAAGSRTEPENQGSSETQRHKTKQEARQEQSRVHSRARGRRATGEHTDTTRGTETTRDKERGQPSITYIPGVTATPFTTANFAAERDGASHDDVYVSVGQRSKRVWAEADCAHSSHVTVEGGIRPKGGRYRPWSGRRRC
jgi:hypothetical protein